MRPSTSNVQRPENVPRHAMKIHAACHRNSPQDNLTWPPDRCLPKKGYGTKKRTVAIGGRGGWRRRGMNCRKISVCPATEGIHLQIELTHVEKLRRNSIKECLKWFCSKSTGGVAYFDAEGTKERGIAKWRYWIRCLGIFRWKEKNRKESSIGVEKRETFWISCGVE